jgi:hypothetical protein
MTTLFNSMLCCSCYEEKLEHETSQKINQEKEKETKPKKKKDVKFAAKNFQIICNRVELFRNPMSGCK